MGVNGWFKTTIGKQATLQRGIDITKAQQRPGKVPVVSSGGVSSFHDTVQVNGPGVVLGRKGVVGSVYYINEDYWPHDTTLWVKDFHDNNPRFVYYFFKSIAPVIARLDVGSANPTLNRNHVHPMKVLWPEKSIQKSVAHILGTLDDKIELNRRMNETLEAMARAVFKSWFVDFDPVRAKMDGRRPFGMDDATAALFSDGFEDSVLGKIPKGWIAGVLNNITQFRNGKAIKPNRYCASGCYPVFGSNGEIAQTDYVLNENPVIVIGRVGAYCGSVHRVDSGSWVTDNAIIATPFQTDHFEYLYQLLHFLDLGRTAIGSAQPLITQSGLKILQIKVPPSDVLLKFERTVRPLYKFLRSNAKQAKSLAAIRDTLLPKLLSGEISVADAEKITEAA